MLDIPVVMSGITGVARITNPLTLTILSVSGTAMSCNLIRYDDSPPGFRSLIFTLRSPPYGLTLNTLPSTSLTSSSTILSSNSPNRPSAYRFWAASISSSAVSIITSRST